ncbi:MAG TPA: hypothetical protein VJO33_06930 [Gemmatimonadaceae bacterium]|nr:hypothetical protein [Gemmatimonadaceae bacterium]
MAQRANAALAAALLDTSSPPQRVPKGPTAAPAAMPPLVPVPNANATASAAGERPPVAKPQIPAAAPPVAGRPMLFPPRPMMPGGASSAGHVARPIVAPRTSGPSASLATPPKAAPAARPSAPAINPPAAASSAPAAPQHPAPAAPRPAPGAAPTGARTPINPFLANDPHAKAKRLARALVSDLVTYFPQKRQDGLRDGTLKQLFKDEIQKSYEEYVLQVGREFAESTPHFQEALNDLLAGGQKVF